MFLYILLLASLGAVFGSFIAAYTYRLSHGISIKSGRSFCDNCKKQIEWMDNIPVLSFVLLGGKCRHCGQKISPRYPLIETFFLLGFVIIGVFQNQIIKNVPIPGDLYGLVFLLAIFTALGAVFIVDLENQIIPDELTYFLIGLSFLGLMTTSNNHFFAFLLSGFCFSMFLLLINLLTKGCGMGLGDVKFAIFPGLLLGPALGTIWLFLSFILGALVGVFLILIGKAKLGRHIPFGPFLVVSLLIVSLFGNIIKDLIF